MRRSEWWVYAAELEAEGRTLDLVKTRSPEWNGNRPQLFISLSSIDPAVRFADGFEKTGSPDLRTWGTRLRTDLLYEGGLSREEAYRALTDANVRLRKEGYGLLNPKPRRTHRVYVIDLDPAVRKHKEVRAANPDADPAMPCVYVGQTGLSLKKRRRQHREGEKAGRRYVTRYGLGRPFLRDLFDHLNPCLPEDALRYERELAEALRAQRYTVTGGH